MQFTLDPTLSMSPARQLRGLIEYHINGGELRAGTRLPSVRQMAAMVGVAPMTVTQVYKELQLAGLVEGQPGRGTYISQQAATHTNPQLMLVRQRMEALVADAARYGIDWAQLCRMLMERVTVPVTLGRSLRITLVGVYPNATRRYADEIAAHLRPGDTISSTTLEELANSAVLRQQTLSADLILTFVRRRPAVLALLGPDVRVEVLTFIPSEDTRAQLARIPSTARVGIVSKYPEITATLGTGLQRFAPHVPDIRATILSSPELATMLAQVDVVVHATGSEQVWNGLGPRVKVIEYRHEPDRRDIQQRLLPMLDELRHAGDCKTRKQAADVTESIASRGGRERPRLLWSRRIACSAQRST
jgi:DNA-binding transcriptional regulator YhcF (GntR family)